MRTRLQRAISRFNRTTLEGYDHALAQWVPLIAIGSLQVYDRFITERSFGQKKRIFYCADGNQFDATKYTVVKAQGADRVYAVESSNPDITDNKAYAHAFLLHEFPDLIEIHKVVSTDVRASGVGSGSQLQKQSESWGSIERYSSINSREFEDVDYTVVTISLPPYINVSTDHVLVANGNRYDVTEVTTNLSLKLIRAQESKA